jgi:hypothetical protein
MDGRTDVRMAEMDGRMVGRMDGWMAGRMGGWVDGWMVEQTDEWMDGRTDGWWVNERMNGWMKWTDGNKILRDGEFCHPFIFRKYMYDLGNIVRHCRK